MLKRRLWTALLLGTAFSLFSLLLLFALCVCNLPLWHRKEAVKVALPRSFFTEVNAGLLSVNYPRMGGCYLSSKNLLGRDEDDLGAPIWGDTAIVVDPNKGVVSRRIYDGPGIFGVMYNSLKIHGRNPFRGYVSMNALLQNGAALSAVSFLSHGSEVFLLHSTPPYISLSCGPEESLRAYKALKNRFLLIFRLAEYHNNSSPFKATHMYIPFLHDVDDFTAKEREQYVNFFANAFHMAVMQFLNGTDRSLSDVLKIPDIRICCGSLAMRDMLELAFDCEFKRYYSSAEAELQSGIAR
ncbi:hypothetical protein ACJZTR_00470 [Neorickettsia risticii]